LNTISGEYKSAAPSYAISSPSS